MNYAIFGAGCFWCVEAIFSQLNGVSDIISGYTGGHTKNPTYKDICTGKTNHVEVCKISYDSKIISFEMLLKIFFESHDPTTLNKQGVDIGTQYRSAIFYNDDKQKKSAEKYKSILNKSNKFKELILTEITKLDIFYDAENYHQNYYKNNPNLPYCELIIKPKLEKVLTK
jgi:peptide-methionine (S)-S-oxide reductase